ncbi:MAG: Serine/threonine protein kinase PrkC, regulator of stationary phase [Labilithrix sp.]|nr:Serine/threonine protein kinase PrkC, regulator of stationary phase [Labilithrix sp.]
MLVTRLADRQTLTRLLRAALRHEVADVSLEAPPRAADAGPHTLDLRLAGQPDVSVIAEPAGAPQDGRFPLRLRPLHRAQAAELFALLEEHPTSSDTRGSAPATVPTGSVAPDTIAGQRTISFGDAAPIVRAMAGSAPAIVDVDPRVTARLVPSDPRRTVPSARWAGGSPAPKRPAADTAPSRGGAIVVPPASDDPRRTVRSASWAPLPDGSGAEADDRSLSVSVVFEPSAEPGDHDDPSLSVSVIFEPGAAEPEVRPFPARPSDPDVETGELGEDEIAAISDAVATLALEAEKAAPPGDDFFDAALANLPMMPEGDDAESESNAVDDSGLARAALGAMPLARASDPALAFARPVPPPPDDDDDFVTLIRLPGAGAAAAHEAAPPRKKKTTRRAPKEKKRTTRHPSDPDAAGPVPEPVAGQDPLLGRTLADGKYVIASAIGSGAAGAVYKATHRELRRSVAIKVLHPHYQQDPQFMKSFRGEALAASQLDHPNVMRVLDFGQEPDGLVYIVMEFLQGRTLQSLLDEERRLQTERAVEIMIQVCAALSVAHDHGIIHRDIKPDNIMLVPSRNDEGRVYELVKVCDFGIAALQNPTRDDAELASLNDNIIAGTPEYMSPEQARGTEVDARSDVYAAGICLYELVTGRPPFLGENAADILVKQLEEEPRPPSQIQKGLDSILEEIILRAIQKEPRKRQQSARELRVELKEVIDPADAGGAAYDDERSIVENVPVLDDPASGFAGFFIALASAVLRFGRFERGHPEAAQAMKELTKATRAALRGRRELTFARRDSAKTIGFCVMSGHGEIVDLRRLLGSQLFGSFGYPFIEALAKKGVAAVTLREGLPDTELHYVIEMLLGPHGNDELRKELLGKPLRHVSLLFGADVIGRDRKLSWKVGLCAARLARDLRALSTIRGISLKKMREIREDLVAGVAHLCTKGDEVRQLLFNSDIIDETVENLRGFSGFRVAPLLLERLLHEPAVDAAGLLLTDLDEGTLDAAVVKDHLRAFGLRLSTERSARSDATVAELYRRGILDEADVPRDLQEQIRAQALADALVRDPSPFLRALEAIQDAGEYGRELVTLEAAMAVLARRAEAGALLAAISVLARHAKGGGTRESHALRTMKTIIDKQRLVPIARALLVGPPQDREAARQLLVLAGSAGAHALFVAREAAGDPAARGLFVKTLRETGAAGWALLASVLPRIEVHGEADVALVEDLLRALPDRADASLGEAVTRFLGNPRLRAAALTALVPLLGDRARKPLLEALEFADDPARVVALAELRRMRGIDEPVVSFIERLLTTRAGASEELRAAAAGALADAAPNQRARALTLLIKGIEGKRGLVAMLRGDANGDETLAVTEAMVRSLLALDRAEGTRVVKARLARADAQLRARLTQLLQTT